MAEDTPTPEKFSRCIAEKLRYADTDRQGHVNNAVYATLFESGRVGIFHDPAHGLPPEGCAFVLARICIDFVAEMEWPGEVQICTSIERIGTSSVTLRQAVFKDGVMTAQAESVGVLTDLSTRRSTKLPQAARAALEAAQR